MESKAVNTAELGRTGAEALRQLRTAIAVTREFCVRLLEQDDELGGAGTRAVLRLNERIVDFAERPAAMAVRKQVDIEVADALCRDPRLPASFFERRLPQLERRLARVTPAG
jgi:hypothetical protein